MRKIVIFNFFSCLLLFFIACKPQQQVTSPLLSYSDTKGRQQAVVTVSDWDKKRTQMRDSLQAAMGPLPSLKNHPAFDVQYRDSLKTENYTRYTITFRVAENEYLPAYLYLPNPRTPRQKHPAMLALHQTANEGKKNTDEGKNMTYAKELAHRGYVVIAPDYPGFGELSDYDFENSRFRSGTMKGIFDHIRCVDLLQSMPEVDPARIGVIGHSLGGHNALFVGAFDTRLQVVVTSCGWTEFEYYNIGAGYGGRLGPWAQDKYMPLIRDKYQLDGDKMPFNFHDIIALIAPRRLFSVSPVNDSNFDVEGVKAGIAKAKEAYRLLKVEDRIQVRYPIAAHDFPPESRKEVYRFIDNIFDHHPNDPDWLAQ